MSPMRGVRVVNIPHDEFDHGETRNVGVRPATSEFTQCFALIISQR